MADPFGPQVAERAPDAGGSVAFAGVRNGVQPGRSGPVEERRITGAIDTCFDPGETEADQCVGRLLDGESSRLFRCSDVSFSRDVVDPGQFDAALAGEASAVGEGLDQFGVVNACQHVVVRRDGHLGVADVLAGERSGGAVDEVDDVIGFGDERVDGRVHIDEVSEVDELEVVADELFVVWNDRRGVAAGEASDGRRRG